MRTLTTMLCLLLASTVMPGNCDVTTKLVGSKAQTHVPKQLLIASTTSSSSKVKALAKSSDSDEQTAEYTRELANYTLWLAILTAFVAAMGAAQGIFLYRADRNAQRSTDIANRALIEAHRPWVKVMFQAGSFEFNANGAMLQIQFLLENVGSSPAENINISSKFIFMNMKNIKWNPFGEMEAFINERRSAKPWWHGETIFPGEKIVFPFNLGINCDELDQATVDIGAIYPTLLGTIEYRTRLDEKIHMTTFMLDIRRKREPRPYTVARNRAPNVIWREEGNVPPGEIVLERSFFGGSHAD